MPRPSPIIGWIMLALVTITALTSGPDGIYMIFPGVVCLIYNIERLSDLRLKRRKDVKNG